VGGGEGGGALSLSVLLARAYLPGMTATELYEQDFVVWTERQARALRALRASRWNGQLDLEHLAEEIEDLGRSQRHACESLLEQIIIHLLKLRWAKAGCSATIWVRFARRSGWWFGVATKG
jgi:hypothetical protein